jgi:hypothetical protein
MAVRYSGSLYDATSSIQDEVLRGENRLLEYMLDKRAAEKGSSSGLLTQYIVAAGG